MKIPVYCSVILLSFLCFACSGSQEEPRKVSADAVAKISGQLKLNSDSNIGGVIYSVGPTMDIYNGSEWSITDIDVLVDSGNATRTFRFSCRRLEANRDTGTGAATEIVPSFVGPLSSGALEAETGDFFVGLKQVRSSRIVSARGFKRR